MTNKNEYILGGGQRLAKLIIFDYLKKISQESVVLNGAVLPRAGAGQIFKVTGRAGRGIRYFIFRAGRAPSRRVNRP